jgi:hypothetical protein
MLKFSSIDRAVEVAALREKVVHGVEVEVLPKKVVHAVVAPADQEKANREAEVDQEKAIREVEVDRERVVLVVAVLVVQGKVILVAEVAREHRKEVTADRVCNLR